MVGGENFRHGFAVVASVGGFFYRGEAFFFVFSFVLALVVEVFSGFCDAEAL